MMEKYIPDTAKVLFGLKMSNFKNSLFLQQRPSLSKLTNPSVTKEKDFVTSYNISKLMQIVHSEGINIRYLELVRQQLLQLRKGTTSAAHSFEAKPEELLLVEMVQFPNFLAFF